MYRKCTVLVLLVLFVLSTGWTADNSTYSVKYLKSLSVSELETLLKDSNNPADIEVIKEIIESKLPVTPSENLPIPKIRSLRDWVIQEGFEGTFPPTGWTLDPASGDGAWVQDDGTSYGPGSAYEGSYAAMFDCWNYSSGTEGAMITPTFDISGLTDPVLKFYWWNDGSSYTPAQLVIQTSTDGTNFTSIDTIDTYGSGDTWVEASYVLDTDVIQVKFIGISDWGTKNTFVDWVSIGTPPAIPQMVLDMYEVDFGYMAEGESQTETITVSNDGGADLTITSFETSSADITVSPSTLTVAPGATGTFDITYTASLGRFEGTVTIHSNDDESDSVVTVAATVLPTGYFIESFEGTDFPPEGWEAFGYTSGYEEGWYLYTYSTHVYDGSQSAEAKGQDSWLVTPQLEVSAGDFIGFWYQAESASYPAGLQVLVSTSPNPFDTSAYVDTLFDEDVSSTDWSYAELEFGTDYDATPVYVAFHRDWATSSYWYTFIDYIALPPIYEGPTECIDDEYEDNDTYSTADTLEFGTQDTIELDLVSCFGDDDWFYFETTGDRMLVTVTTTSDYPDLDIDLFIYQDMNIVDYSVSLGSEEEVTAFLEVAGPSWVQVQNWSGWGDYTLTITQEYQSPYIPQNLTAVPDMGMIHLAWDYPEAGAGDRALPPYDTSQLERVINEIKNATDTQGHTVKATATPMSPVSVDRSTIFFDDFQESFDWTEYNNVDGTDVTNWGWYTDGLGNNFAGLYWSPGVSNYDMYLISPAIDASGETELYLSFWDMLDDFYGGENWFRVIVSNDGFTSDADTVWEFYSDGDYSYDWSFNFVDLSDYAGESSLQIAFQSSGSSTYDIDGWFVDDVKLFTNVLNAFNIYRDGALYASVEGYYTTYTDTTEGGIEHCYTVTAVYAETGESEHSNEACAEALTPLLCPPLGLNAIPGDTSVFLKWLEPLPPPDCGDFVIDAIPYDHYYSNVGATDDFDVNLSDGADIAYELTVSSPITIDITLCDAATDYDTKLQVFSDCETPTDYYNDDGPTCPESPATFPPSELLGVYLTPGIYFIVVDGFGGDEGNYGIHITYSTAGRMVFDAQAAEEYELSKLQSLGLSTDIMYSRTNTRDDNPCGTLQGYIIYMDDDSLTYTTETQYLVTGLENETEYCFTVVADYVEGVSDPTEEVCATPEPLVPLPPTNLTAIPLDEAVELNWTDPATGPIIWAQCFETCDGPDGWGMTIEHTVDPGGGGWLRGEDGTVYGCGTGMNDCGDDVDGTCAFAGWSAAGDAVTSMLITPAIDLTDETGANLTFESVYNWPGDADAPNEVQVSTDGGTTWTTVYSEDPTTNGTWHTVEVDLTDYVGEVINIALVYVSNSGYGEAWFVDDIVVGGAVGRTMAYNFRPAAVEDTNPKTFATTLNRMGRDISQSSITHETGEYHAGTTEDLNFTIHQVSNDAEWIDGFSMTFPEGVVVNWATPTSGGTAWNGETGDGATVTWGDMTGGSGWGSILGDEDFIVNVTTTNFSGPMVIEYTIVGDGWGTEPHTVTYELVLQEHIYVPGEFMGYNVFVDGVQDNEELITGMSYLVQGLTNGVTYTFGVSAEYYPDIYSDTTEVQAAPIWLYGDVEGYVYDPNGDPLDSAIVSHGDIVDTTGPDGYYFLKDLEPGPQDIRAEAPGFDFLVQSVEVVAQEEPVTLDFTMIPFLLRPSGLTAFSGDQLVDLLWRTPGSLIEAELFYDDGTWESSITGGLTDIEVAVKFDPGVAGELYEGRFVFSSVGQTGYPLDPVEVRVYNVGPDGLPGENMYIAPTYTEVTAEDVWITVDLRAENLMFDENGFYLGFRFTTENGPGIARDMDGYVYGHSYVYLYGDWTETGDLGFPGNFMIRAFVGLEGQPGQVITQELYPVDTPANYTEPSNKLAAANTEHQLDLNIHETPITNQIQFRQTDVREDTLLGYNVYRMEEDTLIKVNETVITDTFLTDFDLTNYNEYCYFVRAVWNTDEYGELESKPSNIACAIPWKLGDIDFDDEVTVNDIVKLINFILLQDEPTEAEFQAADANMDGVLDVLDVIIVVDISLGTRFAKSPFDPSLTASLNLPETAGINEQNKQIDFGINYEGQIYGLQFTVRYNPEILKIQTPEVSGDFQIATNEVEPGLLKVIAYSTDGKTVTEPQLRIPVEFTSKSFRGKEKVELEDFVLAGPNGNRIQMDRDNASITVTAIPDKYMLSQNYPNPFNPTTTIEYGLPEDGHVTITIYNMLGQKVVTLVNKNMRAGYHSVIWNGRNDRNEEVSSGIYFYHISTGKFSKAKKMILMK